MSDARIRLAWVLLVGAFGTLLDHAASLGALAALSALVLARVGGGWSRAALLACVGITWATVLSQGLFYGAEPRVPLLELGPVTVWREGVVHGLVQSLRLVAATCAGAALALSTSPDRLCAALLSLGVPWGAAFLAVTALRFVPEAAREWWTVREARARRGRPLWSRGPWAWLVAETTMLRPVAARALRRASALGASLDLRGFDPLAPPSMPEVGRPPALELAGLGLGLALLAALAAAELATALYLHGLAYSPGLRPLYAFVRAWC